MSANPSIFDVISEHPALTVGSLAVGGALGYFSSDYLSKKIGYKSVSFPLIVGAVTAGGITYFVLREQTDPDTFIQLIQESPKTALVSFLIGGIAGGVGTYQLQRYFGAPDVNLPIGTSPSRVVAETAKTEKAFEKARSNTLPIVIGLVSGLVVTYVVLKVWNWGSTLVLPKELDEE